MNMSREQIEQLVDHLEALARAGDFETLRRYDFISLAETRRDAA